MAFGRRGGLALNAPKLITFVLSLAFVVIAVGSLHIHLPYGAAFVSAHRFWIVVAGYALLALGVILPGL